MITLDTSVVVRYLVGTPEDQAHRALRLIETSPQVGVPSVVILEAAHVLRTQYGIARADVLDTLVDLLTRENVDVLGLPRDAVLEALVRARAVAGSPVADALVVATARSAGALPLYTFDEGLARHGIAVAAP